MINSAIKQLVTYGLENNLINKRDINYITNKILETLGIAEYTEPTEEFKNVSVEDTLNTIIDFAIKNNITENNNQSIEQLKSRVMDVLLPMPHEINDNFKKLYRISPKKATNWFYEFSKASYSVDIHKALKNIKWAVSTKYGKFDLCIDINKNDNEEKRKYPECEYCHKNEGFLNKSNLRMIPITLNKEDWMFWYSGDGYYNEQCIASSSQHKYTGLDANTFTKLFEFLNIFPHYWIGADANLPFADSYKPEHDVFVGGNYELAIARADVEKYFQIKKFEDVQVGIVNWPLPVIRIRYKDYTKIVKLADYISGKWKIYRDDSIGLVEVNGTEPCNAIVSVARKLGDLYEIDLILRNNAKSPQKPLGVYHTDEKYYHIKKEHLSVTDIAGMLILPSKLNEELKLLAEKILEGEDLRTDERTAKHSSWVEKFIIEYDDISSDNIMEILQNEIGRSYIEMMESAAVFKRNDTGKQAFERFIAGL